jgi:hypothetical protein
MSWLGDFGGAVLGDVIGTGINTAASSYLMGNQFEYNKQMYQNRYQWTVDDLRKAGLNPILAAGGLSGSSASVGLTGVNSGSVNSGATAYNRINAVDRVQLGINQQNADINQKQTESNIKLQGQQEKTAAAQEKQYSALEQETLQNIINSKITTAAQAFNLHEQGLAARAGAAARMLEADAAWKNANTNYENYSVNKEYYGKLGEESASRKAKTDWELGQSKQDRRLRNEPFFPGSDVTSGNVWGYIGSVVDNLSPFRW